MEQAKARNLLDTEPGSQPATTASFEIMQL